MTRYVARDYDEGHGPEPTCPNCGEDVEKFEATRAYPEYADWAGYECGNCDVRWDWNEWSDGVQKHPDPDENQQAKSLERRQFGHMIRDVWRAIEDDRFEVETPRVHTTQDHFEGIESTVDRDVQQHGLRGEVVGVSAGRKRFTLELVWEPDDMRLYEDLKGHVDYEGPCILYGDMHLWRMDMQTGRVRRSFDVEGVRHYAELVWEEAEPAGWR